MLGKKKFEPKLMYNLTIDNLVPADNFYRRLEEFLDLRFVYQDCKDLYGTTGNPSLDPVVFFKIQLFGYFENIISDRELVRKAGDMLSVRYYLGYDMDENLPWHSTISRTRGLIKQELFEKVFNTILKMCNEAGLIEGKHQSIDSTLVKANASLNSLEVKKPDLEVKEFTRKVYEENIPRQSDNEIKNNNDDNNTEPEKELKYVEKQHESRKKTGPEINKKYVSKTDPDSRVASKPRTVSDLYYATFYSVDSKKKIITEVYTEHADKKDRDSLIEVIDNVEKRLSAFSLKIEEVSADKAFCSGKNLRELEQRGITAFIPAQKVSNNTGGYTTEMFIYDEEKNICICSNKKELAYSGYDPKKELMSFLPKKKDCQECPLKEACCPKADRRHLRYTIYHKEYKRLKELLKTPGAKRAAMLRKTGPEPLYAEAKMYHGLSKYMTRGLDKAQKNAFLIASVQNLKRLLKDWEKLKNKSIGFKFISSPSDFLYKISYCF